MTTEGNKRIKKLQYNYRVKKTNKKNTISCKGTAKSHKVTAKRPPRAKMKCMEAQKEA